MEELDPSPVEESRGLGVVMKDTEVDTGLA